ncbi:hypothetical protein RJ639_028345 [Escallonia herrerae]|uniref:Reverse transcriptase Ty1/copia-type domain-containing protein n=1 Tax=Escallonia herrerae TaxID=1293975 RepID=A0AA88X8G9_9ASTE|nr:hypothetical protein RJ639_028345 [Escallonia herrerae]
MGLCQTSYGIPSGDRGDTAPVTGGDPPPSLAATSSPGLSSITAGPDPEIFSPAFPQNSLTAPSPTLVSSGSEPHSYKTASYDPKWRAAMRAEIDALEANDLRPGKKPIGSKWVYKIKFNSDGSIERYKARVVVRGDTQVEGLDYTETFAPVAKMVSIRHRLLFVQKYLNDCFKLKDIGPLKYFLGIEAARGPRGLFLSQRKYTLDILFESGLSISKPIAFPMEQNHGLGLAGGPLLFDLGPYRQLIGHLVYLTINRPDICYVVHVLPQFMQSPRSQHWDVALRVSRYLQAASGQGLFLLIDSPLQIYNFCDSDWASYPLTRRSVTGYFVSLGNSPISWRTKK